MKKFSSFLRDLPNFFSLKIDQALEIQFLEMFWYFFENQKYYKNDICHFLAEKKKFVFKLSPKWHFTMGKG